MVEAVLRRVPNRSSIRYLSEWIYSVQIREGQIQLTEDIVIKYLREDGLQANLPIKRIENEKSDPSAKSNLLYSPPQELYYKGVYLKAGILLTAEARGIRERILADTPGRILAFLMDNPEEVFSKDFLAGIILKNSIDTRTLDQHVCILRKTIGENHQSNDKRWVKTSTGRGYLLHIR